MVKLIINTMNKNFMNMMQTQEDISSDEEQVKKAPRKLSKKEAREETRKMRENYGTGNQKESTRRVNQRTRGGPRRGRGREKDRESGTGRQACGNSSRRGGYGKGNVGTMENQIEEAKKGDLELPQDEEKKPEPVVEEKIVDLDEYMKEKGISLTMTNKDAKEKELEDPKMFEDENTVAVSYKKKTVGVNKNKKSKDEVVIGGTLMTDNWKPQRRKRNKKKKKNELTEDDFPALS